MGTHKISLVVVAAAILVFQIPAMVDLASTPEPALRAEGLETAPSRVCHPKKPITCRANELAMMPELAEPAESKQAMLCIGPRWICREEGLTSIPAGVVDETPAVQPLTDPQPEVKQAMLCIGPRWICRSESAI